MSLTNFISLLGTAGNNVLKPKTHMLFSRTAGSGIGTGNTIGFFKIQDNGTLMYVGNDDPITSTFENFQSVAYGYSPTKNQAVLWNKSLDYNPGTGVFTYRRHMIAYDMSDPDNPVRVTNSTQNNSTGDSKVVPSISTEQVNATGVGSNASFFNHAVWRGQSRQLVQYTGGGSASQSGTITYNGSSISGGIPTGDTPLLYDEDAGLFFIQINNTGGAPSRATYVANSVTRDSQFRFAANNSSDTSPVGIDVKRKLLFVQSNTTNAGVYRSYQKTVYCLDYSNYPTVTLRSHLDISPTYYQSSNPRVLVHDDKFQYLLNIFSTGQGNPSSTRPGYYLVDTSDPDNITTGTTGRVAGAIDTRNFDYDPAQNTGYFFGNNTENTGNFVHKFAFSSGGVGFTVNVSTDPTSTKNPSSYLTSTTLSNATLLYG